MGKIIVVGNRKGGVGKTTSTLQFAYGLAEQGNRVILLDLDSQGHLAEATEKPKGRGLYEFVIDNAPLDQVVTNVRPKIDAIFGGESTSEMIDELITRRVLASLRSKDDNQNVLVRVLELLELYDYILLDLAPSLDILQVQALEIADLLVIPTKLDYLAIDGVRDMLNTVEDVEANLGRDVPYFILPTFFDRTTNESTVQLTELFNGYSGRVWEPILADVKLREAPSEGLFVKEHASNTRGLVGFTDKSGNTVGGYDKAVKIMAGVL